jgi:hypothetical protein
VLIPIGRATREVEETISLDGLSPVGELFSTYLHIYLIFYEHIMHTLEQEINAVPK